MWVILYRRTRARLPRETTSRKYHRGNWIHRIPRFSRADLRVCVCVCVFPKRSRFMGTFDIRIGLCGMFSQSDSQTSYSTPSRPAMPIRCGHNLSTQNRHCLSARECVSRFNRNGRDESVIYVHAHSATQRTLKWLCQMPNTWGDTQSEVFEEREW